MKNKMLNLTLAAVCGLPFAGFAQGTYLSDPTNASNHAVSVASGGNVGIGTSSPADQFEVVNGTRKVGLNTIVNGVNVGGVVGISREGDGWKALLLGVSENPTADPVIWGGGGGTEFRLVSGGFGSSGFGFYLNSSPQSAFGNAKPDAPALKISGSGNVGIGTASPQAKLDVISAQNEVLSISGGVTASLIKFNAASTDDFVLGTVTSLGGFGVKNITDDRYDIFIGSDGNVGIGTTTPQAELDVAGKVNCTVLELTSDRAQKSGFAPVDRRAILDQVARLPITTWHYTNEPAVRHLGPVAQDFQAAFHIGTDDKHIATVDADGVLFAALQGLNQKLESELQSKDARIAALEKELATLRTDLASRLTALEKVLANSAAADEPTLRSSRCEEAHSKVEVRMTNAE